MTIPSTQFAVQFVGADQFVVNEAKPVDAVGGHQLLLEVEACGICFSDTKLLHAFARHPRKVEVASGMGIEQLREIPSYRPGDHPTVPGHEPVGRIVAVGERVERFRVGERVLVQADWKHLPTSTSNSAFGYNFEGALQEYVLIDERCVVTPEGEELLLRASEEVSAAAIGLIEPWATVEGAYSGRERTAPLPGGRMLVVHDEVESTGSVESLIRATMPAEIEILQLGGVAEAGLAAAVASLAGRLFDDIVYFGVRAKALSLLADRLANHGLLNTVLSGGQLDGPVQIDIGRVHYHFVRYCGTEGPDAAEGYRWLPDSPALRRDDRVTIIGAAGPMGLMHTVRAASAGIEGLSIVATDVSDDRLEHLREVVAPIADRNVVPVQFLNSRRDPLPEGSTYLVCLVPAPSLVAEAVASASRGAIVNAFAGIPAGTSAEVDLQRIIDQQIFLMGSSGSTLGDMATVLSRIEAGLDTSISLDAVCGMDGFGEAIDAVMKRISGGKIMVYPRLHRLPLTRLVEMPERFPTVAARMRGTAWTVEAERELFGLFQ